MCKQLIHRCREYSLLKELYRTWVILYHWTGETSRRVKIWKLVVPGDENYIAKSIYTGLIVNLS